MQNNELTEKNKCLEETILKLTEENKMLKK